MSLSGVDPSGLGLGGLDPAFAHLAEANLGGANLSGADLTGADPRGVNLTRTSVGLAGFDAALVCRDAYGPGYIGAIQVA